MDMMGKLVMQSQANALKKDVFGSSDGPSSSERRKVKNQVDREEQAKRVSSAAQQQPSSREEQRGRKGTKDRTSENQVM